MCFATTVALLYGRLGLAAWLLFLALVLDSADGAVARRQGADSPQTDRAMDIFTEFMLYAAYFKSYPGAVSTALMALWVVPKTVWIGQYVERRWLPNLEVPQPPLARHMLSVVVAFQRFIFAHTLLVLLILQWALKWDSP
jgi:phosphatidylglycerophosphate synthase